MAAPLFKMNGLLVEHWEHREREIKVFLPEKKFSRRSAWRSSLRDFLFLGFKKGGFYIPMFLDLLGILP
jgi:hypothetical protein